MPTVTDRQFGFSPLHMLERDKLVSGAWPDQGPDGFLSQKELRQVMKIQLDGKDKYTQNRFQESQKIFKGLREDGAEAIDYLPKPLQRIQDMKTRMRAAELLSKAYEINKGGEITQVVLDALTETYNQKRNADEISDNAFHNIIGQLGRIARLLNLMEPEH